MPNLLLEGSLSPECGHSFPWSRGGQTLSPGWGLLGLGVLLCEGRARAPGHSTGKGGGDKKGRTAHNLRSLEHSLSRQPTVNSQTLLENWGHLLPKSNSFEKGCRCRAGSWDGGRDDRFQPSVQRSVPPHSPAPLRGAGRGSSSASLPPTLARIAALKGQVAFRLTVPKPSWACKFLESCIKRKIPETHSPGDSKADLERGTKTWDIPWRRF